MSATSTHEPLAPSIGELFAQFLQPAPISDEDAMRYAGSRLATIIAQDCGADFDDVWNQLIHLPEGFLPLLDSREGWYALTSIVCDGLGLDARSQLPPLN